MKVAVVGSSALDMKLAAGPLLRELIKLPRGTVVLLRRPASGEAGAFEQVATRLCSTLGIEIRYFTPDLTTYEGRAATFERDIRMAEVGDSVVALFPKDENMTGGTGHVVEKFHDLDKPSACYEVDEEGAYRWVGGMEGALTS